MSQQHGGVGVPGAAHNAAAKPYHEPAEFAAVLRHTVETLCVLPLLFQRCALV